MHVAVCVVVLLHARVNVRVYARINAWIHRRVLHGALSRCSLHGSNHRHVLHTRMALIVVAMVLVVVLLVLQMGVHLLLVLVLQVLELMRAHVVVVQQVWLVTHGGSGSASGRSVLRSVKGLLHKGSSVLGALLLAANHGEVGLWGVVVGRVDHAQDPHLAVLLVVVVPVKVVQLLLHLLRLVFFWWVQVGHQSVSALGSLGVRHTLSFGGVLHGGSKRARTLTLEVHRLGLRAVDHDLALLLLVEHGFHVLDQLLLAGECLDDVALAVSRNQVPARLVVKRARGHPHGVLLVRRRLHLLVDGLHLVHLVMRLHLVVQRHLVVHLVLLHLVLVLLHLMLLLLQVVLRHLVHLLLLLQRGHVQHVPVVLQLVVVVHHARVREVVLRQRHGGGRVVVHLLVVHVLHLVVLVVLEMGACQSLVGSGRTRHT